MATKIPELHVLYLGNNKRDVVMIKYLLFDYFKCPVFMHYAFSPVKRQKLLLSQKTDFILLPISRADPSANTLIDTVLAARADIPLICMTKKMGVAAAVELIRRGATDCFPAASLSRLPYILDRELIRRTRIPDRAAPASSGTENVPNVSPDNGDITERMNAVQALLDSEKRATALVSELEHVREDLTKEVAALRRLHLISSVYLMLNDLDYIYDEILDAAIDITHADKGFMQLYDEHENCLRLVTQRGLSEDTARFAAVVPCGKMISSAALEKRARVISQNFDDFLAISGTGLTMARSENILCGQATPIISCTGKIYGTLTTFYKEKHDFGERELRFLDLLARQAADFIEKKRGEVALENSEKNATDLVNILQKMDRSKDEFLSHLAHELRNPLATIIAAISLIDISKDTALIRETTDILRNETKQLSRLIDDLLDVTRISTNRVKIKKQYISLNETVLRTAMNFRPQFRQKKISFITNASGPAIYMSADPSRIVQIVENLLMNALTYTDEGGRVILTLRKDNSNAVICVEDNGIGIRSEELPKLFNAFYQAETPNRLNNGLGLGLSVVKGMVELHNGTVSAYSKGIGYGSAFTVTLPIGD